MERIDKVQNLIPEKPEFVHSNQEKGEAIESLKIVNRPVVKKDAAALVTGKSVYTNKNINIAFIPYIILEFNKYLI